MRKLLLLFFIAFLLFIAPAVPFTNKGTIAYAATNTDYVFSDVPEALDAALDQAKRDMNAVGHVMSVNTTQYTDLPLRTFGHICGVTTKQCNAMTMNTMYKQSLAYYAETAMSQIYTNPPASTYAFIIDTGHSLGFIPNSVYAQGIGFSGLSPLLPLWKAFRNIAYLLLALFMIVIGFLIMFRKKIDPKTVITVQNALPNIVITLLLITFSYAIVGILIDFMYLVIMIAISILQPISKGVITDATANQFLTGNFWLVFGKMVQGGWDAFLHGLIPLFGPFKLIDNTPATVENVSVTIGILSAFVTSSWGGVAAGVLVPPAILFAILALAFIIAIVRLLFLLISAYIQIILALLTAPFQLLLGAFPGSHAFEGWMKNIIANLAVFPITAIMILVGSIIVKYNDTGTKLWGPPMLNPGGNSGMTGIIGIGILFAIPSVAGSIKEALKAKPMVAAGPGAVLGPIGSAGGQVLNYAYQISMIKNFLKKPPKGQPESQE